MGCVFCSIVRGEIPALVVFEDDGVLAFLDVGPLAEGHVLVIPKAHYDRLDAMPGEAVAGLAKTLPMLAKAVVSATGAAGYNVLQNNGSCAGQAVGHVHFHIIPRVPGDGLGYRWPAGRYGEGKDKAMQAKIREEIVDC